METVEAFDKLSATSQESGQKKEGQFNCELCGFEPNSQGKFRAKLVRAIFSQYKVYNENKSTLLETSVW